MLQRSQEFTDTRIRFKRFYVSRNGFVECVLAVSAFGTDFKSGFYEFCYGCQPMEIKCWNASDEKHSGRPWYKCVGGCDSESVREGHVPNIWSGFPLGTSDNTIKYHLRFHDESLQRSSPFRKHTKRAKWKRNYLETQLECKNCLKIYGFTV